MARTAAEQFHELSGRPTESVIGVERTDEGWLVEIEAVETRRIPDTTDVLAIYQVEADEAGELLGYHRVRRYIRGKGEDQGGGR